MSFNPLHGGDTLVSSDKVLLISPTILLGLVGGGGVTTIYACTRFAIFWGAFVGAENKFWGITFGKITSNHKF